MIPIRGIMITKLFDKGVSCYSNVPSCPVVIRRNMYKHTEIHGVLNLCFRIRIPCMLICKCSLNIFFTY